MKAREARPSVGTALFFFILSGICFCSLDALAKHLVAGHSVFLVVWARYVGQMAVVTPFARHRGGPRFWHSHKLGLQLMRSTLIIGATVSFYVALRYLPLAEASSITYLAPMFVVMLSWPVLRERPGRARYLATAAGLVGVLFLLRPGSDILQPAALLTILTAIFVAFYHLLTRMLADENPYTTLFYSGLVGALGFTLALPFGWDGPLVGWPEMALLLALGACSGIAHALVIKGYHGAPASLLTPFTYLQMIWATFYGWLFFGQLPDGWSALGMAIIAGSGLILALQERWRRAA